MDPLAIFWSDFESHLRRNDGVTDWYDPSIPSSYTILGYTSTEKGTPNVTHRVLDGATTNVMEFVRAPKAAGSEHEVRVILCAQQTTTNMAMPFSSEVTSELFKECRFHPGSTFSRYLGPSFAFSYFNNVSSMSLSVLDGPWYLNLFASSNKTTGITTIFCHNAGKEINESFISHLEDINTRPFVLHPGYLPSLLLGLIGTSIASSSETLSTRTSVLLRKLGHWNANGEIEQGLDVEADAEEALIIQEDSVMFLLRNDGCSAWSQSLKGIIAQIAEKQFVDERLNPAVREMENAVIAKIDLEMQCMQATARQLQRSLAWSKSVQDWLQVRNAATANKLNTQIALESKRDSSAMKAIAVLTMIFLPGTFFATLFSLPFFNWTATSTPTVHQNFWIYWVVTFPSTIVVLGAWRIWYKLEEWRRENGNGGLFADIRKSVWPQKAVQVDEESPLKED